MIDAKAWKRKVPGLFPIVQVKDSKAQVSTNQQKIFEIEGVALDTVKGWISGDNTDGSFLLKASKESGAATNNYLDFYSEQTSSGNSNKPLLRLYYYEGLGSCYDLNQAGLTMKADMNGDCTVDIEDLIRFVRAWLGAY